MKKDQSVLNLNNNCYAYNHSLMHKRMITQDSDRNYYTAALLYQWVSLDTRLFNKNTCTININKIACYFTKL